MVADNNMEKILIDYSLKKEAEDKELARTQEGGLPLMIIFPGNIDRPGVVLNGSISPGDALKALKYAVKHSNSTTN